MRAPQFGWWLPALAFCWGSGLPFSSPAAAGDPASDAAAQACLDRAARRELAGDYAGARVEYEAFLSAHATDERAPLAAMTIANLDLLAANDSDAAVAAYDRVLRDYAASTWAPEAARRKAECLQAGERWQAAGRAFGEALTLAARSGERPQTAWVNEVSLAAADCFDRAGDQGEVIAVYEAVLDNPLPSEAAAMVLSRLAERYETGGQPEKAAQRYAQLIRSYPASDAAARALEKRAAIEPHAQLNWQPYLDYAAAGTAIRQRDYAAALPPLEAVLAADIDPVLRECAEFRKIVGETNLAADFTTGLARLEALLAAAPQPEALPNTEPVVLNYRMMAEMERQVAESPEDIGALRALGDGYARVRAGAKAVATLERARALAPENADVQFSLGNAYLAAGRTAEARQAYDAYLQQDPNNAAALNMIGYSCLGAGDAAAAIVYFERYAAIQPDDPNAHDSLGEGYLNAGRLEDAAREYERAIEIDPSFVNSYFMLGGVCRQLGRMDRAQEVYERFLGMTPIGDQADQARAALAEMAQPSGK